MTSHYPVWKVFVYRARREKGNLRRWRDKFVTRSLFQDLQSKRSFFIWVEKKRISTKDCESGPLVAFTHVIIKGYVVCMYMYVGQNLWNCLIREMKTERHPLIELDYNPLAVLFVYLFSGWCSVIKSTIFTKHARVIICKNRHASQFINR